MEESLALVRAHGGPAAVCRCLREPGAGRPRPGGPRPGGGAVRRPASPRRGRAAARAGRRARRGAPGPGGVPAGRPGPGGGAADDVPGGARSRSGSFPHIVADGLEWLGALAGARGQAARAARLVRRRRGPCGAGRARPATRPSSRRTSATWPRPAPSSTRRRSPRPGPRAKRYRRSGPWPTPWRTPQTRPEAPMQQLKRWSFNPMQVRPRFEGDGCQGRAPGHEARSAAAAGLCNGHGAAHLRAPVAKLPPWRVAPVRPSPSVVLVVLPPRRRAWGRRSSARILPSDGRTAPAAPAARTRGVKRPEASPLTNAANAAGDSEAAGPWFTPQTRVRPTGGLAGGRPLGPVGHGQRATGRVAPPPAGGDQPALEVLPGGAQERLGGHLREPADAEAPQAVPLLGLAEERLDPDRPLAHGSLIGLGRVVAPDPVEVGLVQRAVHVAPGRARRAGRLGRAGVADRRVGDVAHQLPLPRHPVASEGLPPGAAVLVPLGVVGEGRQRVVGALAVRGVGQGEVGADPRVLHRHDVVDRAVLGVADGMLGAHPPAEAHPPQQVRQGLALHHVAGGGQGVEDDPGPPPVHHVVGLVAQHGGALPGLAHEGGVGVGAAHHGGRAAPVARGQGAPRVEAAPLQEVPLRGLEDQPLAPRLAGGRWGRGDRARREGHDGRRGWRGGCAAVRLVAGVAALGEQGLDVVAHHAPQARDDQVHGGVGAHPRGVEEELPPPHQPGRAAQLHHAVEEAAEHLDPQAGPDLGQGGVVGQGLVERVAQVPAVGQVEGGHRHELALRAQPLEEEDQLELEEDHRVEAGSPARGVAVAHEVAHEREVEHRLQVAVEVVRRHQVVQRGQHRPVDVARLRGPEHRQPLPGSRSQHVRCRAAAAAAARPSSRG